MAYPDLTYRAELDPVTRKELESLVAQVAGMFGLAGIAPNGDADAAHGFQPGDLIAQAHTGARTGWLACDGAAYSREMYGDLFRVIGTTYGAGNGSTTFNVPVGAADPVVTWFIKT